MLLHHTMSQAYCVFIKVFLVNYDLSLFYKGMYRGFILHTNLLLIYLFIFLVSFGSAADQNFIINWLQLSRFLPNTIILSLPFSCIRAWVQFKNLLQGHCSPIPTWQPPNKWFSSYAIPHTQYYLHHQKQLIIYVVGQKRCFHIRRCAERKNVIGNDLSDIIDFKCGKDVFFAQGAAVILNTAITHEELLMSCWVLGWGVGNNWLRGWLIALFTSLI